MRVADAASDVTSLPRKRRAAAPYAYRRSRGTRGPHFEVAGRPAAPKTRFRLALAQTYASCAAGFLHHGHHRRTAPGANGPSVDCCASPDVLSGGACPRKKSSHQDGRSLTELGRPDVRLSAGGAVLRLRTRKRILPRCPSLRLRRCGAHVQRIRRY